MLLTSSVQMRSWQEPFETKMEMWRPRIGGRHNRGYFKYVGSRTAKRLQRLSGAVGVVKPFRIGLEASLDTCSALAVITQ